MCSAPPTSAPWRIPSTWWSLSTPLLLPAENHSYLLALGLGAIEGNRTIEGLGSAAGARTLASARASARATRVQTTHILRSPPLAPLLLELPLLLHSQPLRLGRIIHRTSRLERGVGRDGDGRRCDVGGLGGDVAYPSEGREEDKAAAVRQWSATRNSEGHGKGVIERLASDRDARIWRCDREETVGVTVVVTHDMNTTRNGRFPFFTVRRNFIANTFPSLTASNAPKSSFPSQPPPKTFSPRAPGAWASLVSSAASKGVPRSMPSIPIEAATACP
jgi:hypothetical protein